jgi:hypothetical protein
MHKYGIRAHGPRKTLVVKKTQYPRTNYERFKVISLRDFHLEITYNPNFYFFKTVTLPSSTQSTQLLYNFLQLINIIRYF